MNIKVAYQGVSGAYSHIAATNLYPQAEHVSCSTFSDAFSLVQNNLVDFAVIPIENSTAGRVADVHFLLPKTGLSICAEYFLRIEHQLIGLSGAKLENIKNVYSHPQALAQCSIFLKQHKFQPLADSDTALSCQNIIAQQDKSCAAIASKLAAQLNGLQILASNIENTTDNTTRFLVMSKKHTIPENDGEKFITSFIFKAKNIPSALYKALGGFASNGINITKLESYLLDGKFVSVQFYMEIEAHPQEQSFQNAFDELNFFSEEIHMLGTYQAHPYRYK